MSQGAAALRIGTRGSQLALAQATLVTQALAARGVSCTTVIIETAGDRRAPDTPWGEGAFVTHIEQALVNGEVDLAVHSAKDVPTQEDPRLSIAAFMPREEPRDALVLPAGTTGSLADLPPGTVVGTDSPRRTGFVRARRPDLVVQPLHGNVDTRLRRLDEGAVGALVLAAAGLIRLGRSDRISELLPIEVVPPAPGQGALAVQVRLSDTVALDAVTSIDDPDTRAGVEAERTFLAATGGGCRAPVGALAEARDGSMTLVGGATTLDGRWSSMHEVSGKSAERAALAEALARTIVEERSRAFGSRRVLLTRSLLDSRGLGSRLAEIGIGSVVVPAIDVELLEPAPERWERYDIVVATSVNAVRAVARATLATAAVRWAAVGTATARELRALGVTDVWLPSSSDGVTLARELPLNPGDRVLRLRGDLADDVVASRLRERGATVDELTVYRTVVAPPGSRVLLEEALSDGLPLAIVLASPSAVRGLLELSGDGWRDAVLGVPAIAVGRTTALAAREAGFLTVRSAAAPDADSVAGLVSETVQVVAETVRQEVAR